MLYINLSYGYSVHMTLSSRNKLLFGFSIFASIFLSILFLYTAIRFFVGNPISLPADIESVISFSSIKNFIFNTNSLVAFCGIIFLEIYAPIVCFIVYYSFEKTQSSEIIFFAGFLCGCILECFRLCIPLFNLWNGYSTALIYIGKAAFAGRIMTTLSFLFAAIFSSDTQIQEADKKLLFITCGAAVFAYITPVNSGIILPSVMVEIGYGKLFAIILTIISIITFFIFLFTNQQKIIIGYTLLFTGYSLLILSSSFILIFFGALLLTVGTYLYISRLHNYYLWK